MLFLQVANQITFDKRYIKMDEEINEHEPVEEGMTDLEKDVYGALKIFRKSFGEFIIDKLLHSKNTDKWEPDFRKALYDKNENNDYLQKKWIKDINKHTNKVHTDLLDYQYFEGFAEYNKNLFWPYFNEQAMNLPAWLGEITYVRNTVAHFNSDYLKEEDIVALWNNMGRIAKAIDDTKLLNSLNNIKERVTLKEIFSNHSNKKNSNESPVSVKSGFLGSKIARVIFWVIISLLVFGLCYKFVPWKQLFSSKLPPKIIIIGPPPPPPPGHGPVKTHSGGTNTVKSGNNTGKMAEQTDYSSYINSSLTSSSGKVDVSVTIFEDGGSIENNLSNSIAGIYSKSGENANFGLLKSIFASKPGFQDLFEGNSDIIDKLKLSDYTKNMVVGKLKYKYTPGTLASGTIICTATLSMSIISTSTKSISKSFEISAIGNDVTESDAKETALQKLLIIYGDQHSSL